jgi:hypothetical protein
MTGYQECTSELDELTRVAVPDPATLPEVDIAYGYEDDADPDPTVADAYEVDTSELGVDEDLVVDADSSVPGSPWAESEPFQTPPDDSVPQAIGAAVMDREQTEQAGQTDAEAEVPEPTDSAPATVVPDEAPGASDTAGKPELPTVGDDVMHDIRSRFRDGTMAADRPVQYRVAERHQAERDQVAAWADEWYAANPAPGVDVAEATKRFADTWLKYSLSGGANTESVLRDRNLVEEALGSYTETVLAAKDAGLRRAESIGMFNTADEIKQAVGMAEGHEYVTDAMVKRCMTLRRTDVVGSVGDMIGRVEQVVELYPDRERLDRSTIAYFASNTAPDKFLDKIRYYVDTTERLEAKYQDDPAVSPGYIRETVRKHADPEYVIGERMRFSDELHATYGAVPGLPRSVTKALAFTENDPTTKLDRYVEHMPGIRAAYPDLPLRAVRRLCFYNEDPIAAAGKLADAVAETRAEFPGVLDYHIKYAADTSDNPMGYIRERMGVIDTFKAAHPGLAKGLSDSAMQAAVFRADNPEMRLRALAAGPALSDAREYRREHPKLGRTNAPMNEDDVLARWRSTAPEGIDINEAARRFPRILHGYAQQHPGERDPLVEQALWDKYIDDVTKMQEAGFKRPEALAEYNDATGLVGRILASDTPGLTANIAESRVPTR